MSEFTDAVDARIEEVVRQQPYGRWLYDCMTCGERIHEGPCTKKSTVEPKGIMSAVAR